MKGELGRFLRATVSSTVATGLTWLMVTVMVTIGVQYLAAAAAGALAGAVTDFQLKRHWAFSRPTLGAATTEGVRYVVVAAISLACNVFVSWLLVGVAGMAPVPGVIAASCVVGVAWNYPLHRRFVFR